MIFVKNVNVDYKGEGKKWNKEKEIEQELKTGEEKVK
jgi:hypothetical protein